MIPKGSNVSNFWAAHPLGYVEFALVDEEEEKVTDDSFLESPRKETDGHASGDDGDASDVGARGVSGADGDN